MEDASTQAIITHIPQLVEILSGERLPFPLLEPERFSSAHQKVSRCTSVLQSSLLVLVLGGK